MKFILSIFSSILISLASFSQEAMPQLVNLDVVWNPNPESELAGYQVKVWREGEVDPFFVWDVGNPAPTICMGKSVVRFVYPVGIPAGKWYSQVFAYDALRNYSDPSDKIYFNIRPTLLEYSFDKVLWLTDRPRLVCYSSVWDKCQPPHHRVLSVSKSAKYYRYNHLDTPPPTSQTVPEVSSFGAYLNWDIPHPDNYIVFFNIYKRVLGQYFFVERVNSPSLSFKVGSYGEYSVTCVDSLGLESEKSNVVVALVPIENKVFNLKISQK